MKTAIYIEDGIVQLVITPESEFEKSSLLSFEGSEMKAQVMTGSFYGCQGGWIRHSENRTDKSLILRMDKEPHD